MRKILIITLSLFYFFSYSQIGFGLKAGASLANLNFTDSEYESGGIMPSFYAGVFSEYKAGIFTPEVEITYNRNGSFSKADLITNPDFGSREYKIDYTIETVSFSFVGKFNVFSKFNLKAGYYYGSIISVESNTRNFPTHGKNEKQDLTDSWNETDSGVILGANWDITKHLFIDLNYIIGLNDIRGYSSEVNSRVLRIGAGYRL